MSSTDEKAIKITKLIREIEKKQKTITMELLGVYVDGTMNPKSVGDSAEMAGRLDGKVNKKFIAREMFNKEDGEKILNEHNQLLDEILSYQGATNNKRIRTLIIGGVVLLFVVWLIFPSSKKDTIETKTTSSITYTKGHTDTVSDSVSNAYKLCSVLDDSGVLSKPCDISGFGQSVEITTQLTGAEARAVCKMYTNKLKQESMLFDYGWTLKIYSPYSGENTIAVCKLPN